METLQSIIFIEFDVNTKKITFLRGDNIVDYDSNATSVYVRVKYKNLSGNTVYLTPSELKDYKFSLYTIKPATNNVNLIRGEVTDELKENVYGGVVKFEIPRVCTNRLGIVKCEIHINQGNKIIGSSTFVLDVKQSLVTAFDDELLGDEDFPVLRQLILEIQKANNIDDNNISKITTYSSDKIEKVKEDLNLQIKEKASKNEIFSMANMGQDIREAMTGGSVAVVGENTILPNNIVNQTIATEKLNEVLYKPIADLSNYVAFDFEIIDGSFYSNYSHELLYLGGYSSATINCEYGEEYLITKLMIGGEGAAPIMFKDANDNYILSLYDGESINLTNEKVTVPFRATKLCLSFYTGNIGIKKLKYFDKVRVNSDKIKFSDMRDELINSLANKELGYQERGSLIFIDDDGRSFIDDRLLPLITEKNIPYNFAMFSTSEYLNDISKVTALQNSGHEILGHSIDSLDTYDEETLINFFENEKSFFESKGINVNNFVYGNNTSNNFVRAVAKGYYDKCCGGDGVLNDKKRNALNLGRIWIQKGAGIQYYKNLIDEAINKKQVLILYCHSNELADDETYNRLVEIIDYAKSTEINITTLNNI